MFGGLKKVVFLQPQKQGALAQLARALAWHARGHRFDSVMLHKKETHWIPAGFFFYCFSSSIARCKISSMGA